MLMKYALLAILITLSSKLCAQSQPYQESMSRINAQWSMVNVNLSRDAIDMAGMLYQGERKRQAKPLEGLQTARFTTCTPRAAAPDSLAAVAAHIFLTNGMKREADNVFTVSQDGYVVEVHILHADKVVSLFGTFSSKDVRRILK